MYFDRECCRVAVGIIAAILDWMISQIGLGLSKRVVKLPNWIALIVSVRPGESDFVSF